MLTLYEWVILFIPLVTGFGTSLFCPTSKDAGASVTFRPPSWVFALIWPILYILLGLAWIYAQRASPWRSLWYVAVTATLVLWLIIYNCASSKVGGIWVLFLSLLFVVIAMIGGPKQSTLLLSPLLIWLFIATVLNIFDTQ